ncbi:pre-mRNA-splicing factor of RES complex domain-containing protein [Ditylenchus destructor]|uniref:BUD13 homolog n=1 Tax=Ditylenchus destructor TaxID=166010 RepID=A0AAD4NC40_9BILA|nr:pre-mRNA-splicing factor of RES complex domain-containing protein [Ditylenchus destructor]
MSTITSLASSSSKPSTSGEASRAEYLKKYLSGGNTKDGEKSKKKSKAKHRAESGGGLRLLDDDTFLPLPPPEKTVRKIGAYIDKTHPSGWDEEEEDEDERLLREARAASKSKFKTDSFVTIDDRGDKKARDDKDSSPLRQRKAHRSAPVAYDGDQSPVRRKTKASPSFGDRETVKQEPLDSDSSPPRQIKRETNSNGDLSPPRLPPSSRRSARRDKDGDLSPKRQRRASNRASPSPMRIKKEPESTRDVAEEDNSGRYAETRTRVTLFNKTKKSNRRKEDEEDPERKEREAKGQQELEKKYKHWNKGVAQLQEREEKLKEMEQTMQEGFARYADNEVLNDHLKDQLLEDDPMADYFKTKNHKVQMQTGLVYPKYERPWPPNRFSLPPGYRWDGVDRSNGFEGKLALTENKRRARETEAYRSIMECEE